MAGLNGEITIGWQRRRATVYISDNAAKFNDIESGTHECHVLGLFQYSDGESEVAPYFICELHSGQNIYADPMRVRFMDTDERGVII
jgi:hypothetical protein